MRFPDLKHFNFVLKHSRPHASAIVGFLLAIIGNSAVTIAFAYLLGMLMQVLPQSADQLAQFGQADAEKALDIAWKLLYLGIPAALGLFVFHGLAVFLRRYIALKATLTLRQALCDRLLLFTARYLDRTNSGEVLSKASNDTGKIELAFEIFWGELTGPAITLLALVPTAFIVSWKLALLSLVALPLIIHLVRRASKKILKASMESLEHLGDMTETLREIMASMRVVRVFQLEDISSARFADNMRAFYRASLKALRAIALNAGLMEGITYLIIVVLSFLGCYFTLRGGLELSLDKLGVLFYLFSEIYKNIKACTRSFNNIQPSFAAIDRFEDLLAGETIAPDPPDAAELKSISGSIEFRDVVFSYGGETVLNGVSFTVPAGSRVALVGRSGSGKTTIVNLLSRFYEIDSGSILIDEVDIRGITRTSLLSNIAMVSQEPVLFNDSVRNNIRLGNSGASDADLARACDDAFVSSFVPELTEGLDTKVGERGASLSGGQRQRVTIARAMLKNAPLLLLDEATSSLDTESERAVQKALSQLMKGRTTIAIAHRLSTIRDSDIILVLEAGRITEQGTHEQLLARDGAYAKMLNLQEGGEAGT